MIYTVLVVLLILALFGAPSFGWHSYGWYPSTGIGFVLLVIVLVLVVRGGL